MRFDWFAGYPTVGVTSAPQYGPVKPDDEPYWDAAYGRGTVYVTAPDTASAITSAITVAAAQRDAWFAARGKKVPT